MFFRSVVTAAAIAFSISVHAQTPNTTASGAVAYEVGQGWVSSYFDGSESERWFSFKEEGGNSYCIEVVQGSVSPINLPSKIEVYSDANGASILVSDGKSLSASNPRWGPFPGVLHRAWRYRRLYPDG